MFSFFSTPEIGCIMRLQQERTSTTRRLFFFIVWFNVGLLIWLLIAKWTVRTSHITTKECEDFNTLLRQLKVPLLCMFTTFKPNIAKIPVNMYFLTYSDLTLPLLK